MAVENSRPLLVNLASGLDYDGELIERIRADKVHGMSSKLLKFSLAFIVCDAYPRSDRHQQEPTSELYVELSHLARNSYQIASSEGSAIAKIVNTARTRQLRLQDGWTAIYLPICYYLSLKPITVFCLRILLNLEHENNKKGNSSSLVIVKHHLEWLLDFLGDPQCSLAQTTPLVYLGAAIGAFLFNCFRIHYFRSIHSFDSSITRFLLDPKREVRRVNSTILENVNLAFEGVERRRREVSSMLEEHLKLRTLDRHQKTEYVDEHNRLYGDFVRLMNQSNSLRQLRGQLDRIRPKAFQSDWYRYCSYSFLLIAAFVILSDLFVFVASEIVITYLSWRNRCNRLVTRQGRNANHSGLAECPFAELFTPAEILAMIEECISLNFFTNMSVSIFFVIGYLQVRHQHYLTANTEQKMTSLLLELRNYDLSLCQGGENHHSEMDRMGRLDSLMYENLIGLWIFDSESKRNVAQIEHITYIYFVLVFFTSLVAFGMFNSFITARSVGCRAHPLINQPTGSENSNDTQAREIPFVTFIMVWGYSNLTLLLCAAIPARVIRLKRVVISVFAQMLLIADNQRPQQRQKHQRPAQLSAGLLHRRHTRTRSAANTLADQVKQTNNPLLALWQKIVLARNFPTDNYSVKVYNFEITYAKALELNFYLVTFGSWITAKYFHKST